MPTDPIATAVEELVDTLVAAGIPASADPAEVNPPAAWVSLEAIDVASLGGVLRLTTAVYIISPDTSVQRALELLAPLLRTTLTVIRPDGTMTTQGVVLPDSSTPLPAIRVPVNLKA